jgi:hypothetical protein
MHDSLCNGNQNFTATVYSDTQKGGIKAYFCHKIDNLSDYELGNHMWESWNDQISSIHVDVQAGYCVRFFKAANQLGGSFLAGNGTNWSFFSGDSWNDVISSMKMVPGPCR